MNEEQFMTMIALGLGGHLLWRSTQNWRSGKVSDGSDDDNGRVFSYEKQPAEFARQLCVQVLGGIALTALGIWGFIQILKEYSR
ncbi:MAG: hypothetical protein HZA92_09585 [Verrucomicrobia bacterium]|nr:hypothetical protein [Verrucomicrobiota bacterium]